MAARNFTKDGDELQRGVVTLYLRATGGGATANCVITHGLGVASVNYNAATGLYTITLRDTYVALLHADLAVEGPANAQFRVNVISNAVSSTKKIEICTSEITEGTDADIALADLTTNHTLVGTIKLLNTAGIPVKGS